MNRKSSLYLTMIILLALLTGTGGQARASDSSAAVATGYYMMYGHEGIPTIGADTSTHGAAPSVGDYATTHCRYINVANTGYGDYYLIYPLHLPNGVTITTYSAYVADFNSTGNMYGQIYKRTWNSTSSGTAFALNIATTGTASNEYIYRTGFEEVVNNGTTQYWIQFTPVNSADPGQLCVYGVRVTYTYEGAFLPMIHNGN